jgi:hypothetical protein
MDLPTKREGRSSALPEPMAHAGSTVTHIPQLRHGHLWVS